MGERGWGGPQQSTGQKSFKTNDAHLSRQKKGEGIETVTEKRGVTKVNPEKRAR